MTDHTPGWHGTASRRESGWFGMGFALGILGGRDDLIIFYEGGRSNMHPESAIIERVETLIHHPTFTGSDGVMETVLEDLECRACAHQISQVTYGRLREMLLRSPHFARNN
jgi:hypothetical protein